MPEHRRHRTDRESLPTVGCFSDAVAVGSLAASISRVLRSRGLAAALAGALGLPGLAFALAWAKQVEGLHGAAPWLEVRSRCPRSSSRATSSRWRCKPSRAASSISTCGSKQAPSPASPAACLGSRFNGIGIPLAATGLVYPVWAVAAMALSATAIFFNSLWDRPRLFLDAILSVGRAPSAREIAA